MVVIRPHLMLVFQGTSSVDGAWSIYIAVQPRSIAQAASQTMHPSRRGSKWCREGPEGRSLLRRRLNSPSFVADPPLLARLRLDGTMRFSERGGHVRLKPGG